MKANLDDIYLFSQTVLHEGISAAAHANGLQRSKVSRRLRMLEEALGTELLIRTTRNIELTTQGKELFALTKQPLEQIIDGVNALTGDLEELSGKLRIAIPSALMSTNLFNNILTEYIETYPDINIEVENHQEGVDLKRQSFDIQVLPSVVKVADNSYVQFSVLPYRCHLVASPDYLARHNKISSPLDLKEHRILTNRYNADLLAPHLNIALKSDDLYVLLNMATSGTGIAFLPKVNTRVPIDQGVLVEVLTGMSYPEQHLTLIYPSSSYLPRKVKALIDIFREKYS
ncbi:LysR family transcriptional regulator [Thalassotalea euphylliae]|uniref:LysR family transcriptional regulator n=1 Tax=Thalassotalea euphylliae TaxID=1655234 RepID=A0A3E0UFZ5_9GAMM|nr:LysR family transcriptional regulator [Thalassotalea euphylliae]REL35938.1 LysR family transcriptional regulator [Thalassotalea euphylliae]